MRTSTTESTSTIRRQRSPATPPTRTATWDRSGTGRHRRGRQHGERQRQRRSMHERRLQLGISDVSETANPAPKGGVALPSQPALPPRHRFRNNRTGPMCTPEKQSDDDEDPPPIRDERWPQLGQTVASRGGGSGTSVVGGCSLFVQSSSQGPEARLEPLRAGSSSDSARPRLAGWSAGGGERADAATNSGRGAPVGLGTPRPQTPPRPASASAGSLWPTMRTIRPSRTSSTPEVRISVGMWVRSRYGRAFE